MLNRLLITSSAILLSLSNLSYAGSSTDSNPFSVSLSGIGATADINQSYPGVQLIITNNSTIGQLLNADATLTPPAGFTNVTTTCTQGATLAPSTSCSFTGDFTPTAVGTSTWSATMVANRQTFSDLNASVNVIDPTPPPPVNINATMTTPTSPLIAGQTYHNVGLTLTNNGTASVSFSSVTNPSYPAGFVTPPTDTCSGQTIASGASCEISSDFTPSQAGAYQWSASFAVNGSTDLKTFNPPAINVESPPAIPHISSDDVHRVVLGADGTIYIAAIGGLDISHDHGQTFQHATMQNGLSSNDILAVAVDSKNNIYVGTDNGLNKSTDGGKTFQPINNSDVSSYIYDLMVSTDTASQTEILYVATTNGLAYSTDQGGTFSLKQNGSIPNTLPNNNVIALAQDAHNNIFVATNESMSKSDNASILSHGNDAFNNVFSGNHQAVSTLFATPDGKIYIGTPEDGYFFADSFRDTFKQWKDSGLPNNDVRSIAVITSSDSNNGTIYVGTGDGLAYWKPGFTSFETINPINTSKVTNVNSVAYDNTNSTLYVGLAGGGLAYSTDNKNFTTIDSTGIASAHTNQIFTDPTTNIMYVGTDTGLSISSDGGKTFTTKTIADGLNNLDVVSVMANGENVYAATKDTINVSHDEGKTFTAIDAKTFNGATISYITGSPTDPNTIYVGTDKGLYLSSDQGKTFTADSYITSAVHSIYINSAGIYYVSTDTGISYMGSGGPGDVTTIQVTNSQGPLAVFSAYVSDDGKTIFAATSDGLYQSTDSGNSFTKTSNLQLPTQNIHSVQMLNSTIYVSSDAGMAESTDGGKTFSTDPFSLIDNAKLSVNNAAILDGQLWVSTRSGIFNFAA